MKYYVYKNYNNIITGEEEFFLQAIFQNEEDAKEYAKQKNKNKLGFKYLIEERKDWLEI